ncbi:hypothetical protein Cni_G25686 [Canna indica]|uniref:Uncharacterized protein n=1 Tax=Canna indica TaxID=4628 RepID=A0AAQ3L1K8_9LILI|nr:hypothetical protein Cni_G25686 [Canna indica]
MAQTTTRGSHQARIPGWQPRSSRQADRHRLRQQLLPEPSAKARAAALEPGALQQLVAGLAGLAVQQQCVCLCGSNGKDGKHQPADGEPRIDQIEQQEGGLITYKLHGALCSLPQLS